MEKPLEEVTITLDADGCCEIDGKTYIAPSVLGAAKSLGISSVTLNGRLAEMRSNTQWQETNSMTRRTHIDG